MEMGAKEMGEAEMNNNKEEVEKMEEVVLSSIDHCNCQRRKKMMRRS